MLKKFKLLAFACLVFIIGSNIISADPAISDDNQAGTSGTSYGGGGDGGGSCTHWLSGETRLQAVRVRVFRQNKLLCLDPENEETCLDKYYSLEGKNDNGECNTKTYTGILCETPGYNYSTIEYKEDAYCEASPTTLKLGCLQGEATVDGVNKGLNKSIVWESGGPKADGKILDNYLRQTIGGQPYANLIKLLNEMGYDENTFDAGDVVIIEPVTSVSCGCRSNRIYVGTSTALMKMNLSYFDLSSYIHSSNYCNPSKQSGWDTARGFTFSDVYRNMSKAFKITNASFKNSAYTGFGFFRYNVSEIYYIPNTNTIGCLEASISAGSGYSLSNVFSDFTDQITITGTPDTALCRTSITASSAVGNGPFSAKAGQMYMISTSGKATTLTVKIKCYLPTSSSYYSEFSVGKLSNYLTNVKLGGVDLTPASSMETEIKVSCNPSTRECNSSPLSVDYYFKKIYSKIGTGEIIEINKDESLGSSYKFLGYGKISKLTDEYKNKEISFEIVYKQNSEAKSLVGDCKVTVTPEIIIKNKPHLIFRTVNTTIGKTFLNADGSVRESGSNWQGYESIITTNNNSYNKNAEPAPKYKITLTPNTIEKIRLYNKQNEYSDYKMTCKEASVVNGEAVRAACVSDYLTTLKKSYGLEINNSKVRECFEGKYKNSEICPIKGQSYYKPQYYGFISGTIGETAVLSNTSMKPPVGATSYIGYDVKNGKVSSVYICFVMDGTEYCLKGNDAEAYAKNKTVLDDVCGDKISGSGLGYGGTASCRINNLLVFADSYGYVGTDDEFVFCDVGGMFGDNFTCEKK